ncbi:L-lactate dehydrogenase [Allorhizobium undicola]|uniref:L-lactate dehydrogenase n=1 Tax=Allorhizobium undicola TaxID=78527 RepID=UPI003D3443B4
MKIGIVGAGMVGSSAAYALSLLGIVSEIVLVDQNTDLAAAQAADISHAVPFFGACTVRAGDYQELASAAVVILAAGVGQKPGESRLALLSRNAEVFRDVVAKVLAVSPDALLLIASNPVDVMTDVATRLSGLPPHRVIGSGTILDTARFRSLLGHHLGVSPQSVHAYVLGEHGDSEVLVWSSVRIGSVPLQDFAAAIGRPVTEAVRSRIEDDVRNAAYKIINGKGASYYGIGAGLAAIVRSIVLDQREVFSVSSLTRTLCGVPEVTASVPRIIGREGIVAEVAPPLERAEELTLAKSATLLKDLSAALKL